MTQNSQGDGAGQGNTLPAIDGTARPQPSTDAGEASGKERTMDVICGDKLLKDRVLGEIDAILPDVARRAETADRGRKVPEETIAALAEANLLNLIAPRKLGGLEADFSVASAVSRKLATACGSTAWAFAILAEGAWISALFPQAAQDEVWSGKPLVCASILPLGKAERVAGGYRVNGHWGYLSGSDYATWVILCAKTDAEDDSPLIVFIVPKSEVRMLSDWNVLGLRGTGSHGGIVEDLFVPEHRTMAFSALSDGTTPGREVHPDYILARAPRAIVTAFSLTPVIVGLATHALEIGTGLMQSPSLAAQPDWGSVQARYSEAAIEVSLANTILDTYSTRTDRMLRSNQSISNADMAETRLYASYMNRMAHQAIDRIAYISGSKWLYDSNAFQIVLRDAKAAASHRSCNWEMASINYCTALGLGSAPPRST
jgi:3-hydroxy-9,10-secoandrosta-1,3,5(10)-triene-9,17-dione monooxygenase